MPLGYLLFLAATLLIELPLAAALAGVGRRRETLHAALALNLLTHPVATAVAILAPAVWLPVELVVILVEAQGYSTLAGLTTSRALLVALVANFVSAIAGITLAMI